MSYALIKMFNYDLTHIIFIFINKHSKMKVAKLLVQYKTYFTHVYKIVKIIIFRLFKWTTEIETQKWNITFLLRREPNLHIGFA